MKVAVIGSRSFRDYEELKMVLDSFKIDLIVSGGAIGADKMGEYYAREHDIKTLIFLPDWEQHGKAAGFIRNKLIVKNSDLIIAFWDQKSKGTKNSLDYAQEKGTSILMIPFQIP